ncbi:MAG: TetR/AcrR family transcriptional regulator [Planctomycetota bacterium]
MNKQRTQDGSGDRQIASKRRAIPDAAVRVFQRNGFDGVSMDRIAEEIPASECTVHNHFSSKDVLFSAVVAELIARGRRRTEIAFELGVSPESRLARFARQKHEQATDPAFAALFRMVATVIITKPKSAQEVVKSFQAGYEPLESWMRAAHGAGVLSIESPEMDARLFSGSAAGLLFWPQVLGVPVEDDCREKPIESIASDFVRAGWRERV